MIGKIKKYLLLLVSIIFFIIFYEFYLRFAEIATPSFIYDDPKLGRTFKPDTDILFINAEGFYMGRVNSYGYIGKGYPKEKRSDVLRIAIFGDSFIEGLQLFERNHFRTLVETNLTKRLNKNVEILNFGIGGADFSDMYYIFQEKGIYFHPDIVLFSVKRTNLRFKGTIPKPKYYLENDSLKINFDFFESNESILRKRFAIIREFAIGHLIKETYENYKNGLLAQKVFEKFYVTIDKEVTQLKKVSPDSVDKDIQYPVNKKIFEELNQMADRTETKIMTLIADDFPEYYYPLLDSMNKIYKVYIPPALNDYNNKEFRYWKASGMYGHWNQKAHIAVSEFLTAEIISLYDSVYKKNIDPDLE